MSATTDTPADSAGRFQLPEVVDFSAHRKAGVGAKLAWIVGQMERIPKRGFNNQQNYAFATESDIVDFVRPYLEVQNLAITWDTELCVIDDVKTSNGKTMARCIVHVRMNFWDGDHPERDPVRGGMFPGMSVDSGDKAVTKALTSAKKYAYLLTFHLSTGENLEDPKAHEADPPANGRRGGGGNQPPAQHPPRERVQTNPNDPIVQGQINSINNLIATAKKEGDWTDERTAKVCKQLSRERGDGAEVDSVDKLNFGEAGKMIAGLQKYIKEAKKANENPA